MYKTLALLLFMSMMFFQTAPPKPAPPASVQIPQTRAGTIQTDDVELLKRDVARLRSEVQDLHKQMDKLNSDVALLNKSLSGVPSLIAHCEGGSTSLSVRGKRSCSPYACDAVSGTCLQSCQSTLDCSGGTECDSDFHCRRY